MTADTRERFLTELAGAREQHRLPFDLRGQTRKLASGLLGLLFPHFAARADNSIAAVRAELEDIEGALGAIMACISPAQRERQGQQTATFLDRLPRLRTSLVQDAEAIFYGDPAASSIDEVVLTYPGFFAISIYRMAHELYLLEVPLLPRLLTEFAHQRTGVDIHPGATIGPRFFIDHGTGVVIGETTVIGSGVKLYQGVTLGALVVEKQLGRKKRHPTLEDHVVVYSNATILGGETVVGHDSVVGGNAWLTHSVPPFSAVSHESEVRPRRRNANRADADYEI